MRPRPLPYAIPNLEAPPVVKRLFREKLARLIGGWPLHAEDWGADNQVLHDAFVGEYDARTEAVYQLVDEILVAFSLEDDEKTFSHEVSARRSGMLEGIQIASEVANGVEPDLLKGMSERYVSIYCTARRDASDLIKGIPTAPCEYCGNGKRTGLPGNHCENCMDTGLKFPDMAGVAEQSGAGAPETPVRCGAPAAKLCEDCPPSDYPTNKTRCNPCPRRDDFPSSEAILDKAKTEGRDTYRLGLARTLNPYMSTQIRDAWFAGYDDGATS